MGVPPGTGQGALNDQGPHAAPELLLGRKTGRPELLCFQIKTAFLKIIAVIASDSGGLVAWMAFMNQNRWSPGMIPYGGLVVAQGHRISSPPVKTVPAPTAQRCGILTEKCQCKNQQREVLHDKWQND